MPWFNSECPLALLTPLILLVCPSLPFVRSQAATVAATVTVGALVGVYVVVLKVSGASEGASY